MLPREITRRLVVEAGISQGWAEWVGTEGKTITVDKYGASAPAGTIYEKYGLTVENVIDKAEELLRRK